MPERLLVCLDGEAHTQAALRWAVRLAQALDLPLTGLHVKDPYLKQFYNDIYAQGRREYLEHVEDCLETQARMTAAEFAAACAAANISGEFSTRVGEPAAEILQEIADRPGALLVLGGKPLTWLNRLRSRDLPGLLARRVTSPLMIVRR